MLNKSRIEWKDPTFLSHSLIRELIWKETWLTLAVCHASYSCWWAASPPHFLPQRSKGECVEDVGECVQGSCVTETCIIKIINIILFHMWTCVFLTLADLWVNTLSRPHPGLILLRAKVFSLLMSFWNCSILCDHAELSRLSLFKKGFPPPLRGYVEI